MMNKYSVEYIEKIGLPTFIKAINIAHCRYYFSRSNMTYYKTSIYSKYWFIMGDKLYFVSSDLYWNRERTYRIFSINLNNGDIDKLTNTHHPTLRDAYKELKEYEKSQK